MSKYKFEDKIIDVDLFGTHYKVRLTKQFYNKGGRIAIEGLMESDELMGGYDCAETFAFLTCNLPTQYLDEDEVFIKDWSENEQFAKACLESRYFLETGRVCPTGFVNSPVWKMIKEAGNV